MSARSRDPINPASKALWIGGGLLGGIVGGTTGGGIGKAVLGAAIGSILLGAVGDAVLEQRDRTGVLSLWPQRLKLGRK
jgi:outer membrane lipoprotein SlyB